MADAPTDAAPWIALIEADEACPARQRWLKRAKTINTLYREDRNSSRAGSARRRFALFWSNIATLQPAVYARTPQAVVSRRYKTDDPVGRQASEVLERALNFSLDTQDFASVMTTVRDEYLLIARGLAWERYEPRFAEDGERVEWEESKTDHVCFDDFGHNIAREWSEVTRGWRKVYKTRAELIARFGRELGERIPLDRCVKGRENDESEAGKQATVYELWDKPTKQVVWLSKGYPTSVLDIRPDPLGLHEFFPFPKPAFGTLGIDSTVPVPDYVYYQDQLEEVDDLTQRIGDLIDALKLTGLYAGEKKEELTQLETAMKGRGVQMVPVDTWAMLKDAGGLKGVIEWFPVEQVIAVLKGAFETRKQIVDDVYQVTGISDIMRGDTDPNETMGAQQLKSSWGSSRVRDRQKELSRFARDVIRLKAEIVASKFGQQTLAQMTDVQMLTAAEAQQAQRQLQAWQMVAQQAQAAQQPPPPNPVPPAVQQMLGQPTWDDVMALLRNPVLRTFRIEIETDSTIEPNDQEEKQRRIEFVQAVGKYLAETLPVVQASPAMLPVVTEGLKFLVRGFRVGREMEDLIDRALDQLQSGAGAAPQGQDGANPQAEAAKAQAANTSAQANLISAQARAQDAHTNAFKAQSQHVLGMAEVQAENARTAADAHLGQQAQNLDERAHVAQVIQKAEDRALTHEINDRTPIAANTR